MTQADGTGLEAPRLRERRLLETLARVAAGLYAPDGKEDDLELRQLGYGSHLARGRVEDPEDNLGRVAIFCMEELKGEPPLEGPFRDPVQEQWSAPWHLEVGRLRSELPVYL